MNRLYFTLALLIVGIASLLGVLFSNRPNQVAPLPPEPIDKEIAIPKILSKDELYQQKILEHTEEQAIVRGEKEEAIELTNKAIQSEDANVCSTIQSDKLKEECTQKVYVGKALRTQDITLCAQIADQEKQQLCKDRLQFILAEKAKDKKLCLSISDTSFAKQCTDTVEENLINAQKAAGTFTGSSDTACDIYTSTGSKNTCIDEANKNADYEMLSKAVTAGDMFLCQKILNESLKVDCEDSIYFLSAKKTLILSTCEKIKKMSNKENCKKSVTTLMDANYSQEAFKEKSIALCDKIVDTKIRSSCRDRVLIVEIIKSANVENCMSLSDLKMQNVCKESIQPL